MAFWLAWYAAASAPPGGRADVTAAPFYPPPVQRPVAQSLAPLTARHDPMRVRLEQLSEGEMKSFYSRCSEEGVARRLDGGEAMACSIGYDVLLNKHFSGDFERLLLWSRSRAARDIR
jgi:hypothetical protein